MQGVSAKVTDSGQLQLPPEILKALGLDGGGKVVIEVHGSELRIRTFEDLAARAQELSRQLLADRPEASVDDFLAHRRRETDGE